MAKPTLPSGRTVPETPTVRKPCAFHGTLHGLVGILTKLADHIPFLEPESGAVVTTTAADTPHLVVLGEVATATTQYLDDMARGGYAAMACSRPIGVA